MTLVQTLPSETDVPDNSVGLTGLRAERVRDRPKRFAGEGLDIVEAGRFHGRLNRLAHAIAITGGRVFR